MPRLENSEVSIALMDSLAPWFLSLGLDFDFGRRLGFFFQHSFSVWPRR